jgi:hypothetical protein
MSREALLANAPAVLDAFVLVPQVKVTGPERGGAQGGADE